MFSGPELVRLLRGYPPVLGAMLLVDGVITLILGGDATITLGELVAYLILPPLAMFLVTQLTGGRRPDAVTLGVAGAGAAVLLASLFLLGGVDLVTLPSWLLALLGLALLAVALFVMRLSAPAQESPEPPGLLSETERTGFSGDDDGRGYASGYDDDPAPHRADRSAFPADSSAFPADRSAFPADRSADETVHGLPRVPSAVDYSAGSDRSSELERPAGSGFSPAPAFSSGSAFSAEPASSAGPAEAEWPPRREPMGAPWAGENRSMQAPAGSDRPVEPSWSDGDRAPSWSDSDRGSSWSGSDGDRAAPASGWSDGDRAAPASGWSDSDRAAPASSWSDGDRAGSASGWSDGGAEPAGAGSAWSSGPSDREWPPAPAGWESQPEQAQPPAPASAQRSWFDPEDQQPAEPVRPSGPPDSEWPPSERTYGRRSRHSDG